jgi:universal stress protein E
MRSIRRILVSIKDPAHGVTPAAKKAAQLARATGARLELFHAITTPIYLDCYTYSDWSLADAKRDIVKRRTEQLERIAQSLSARGRQRKVDTRINASWDYPSYEAIIRRAAAFSADLVVADRHAGRHLARPVMRFADWELLRSCPVPVLLVGAKDSYQRPVILAAVDPAHKWAKPALLDTRILSMGAMLSAAMSGQLHAVHAYESVPLGIYSIERMDPTTCQDLSERLTTAATARFARTLRNTHIRGLRRHLVDAPAVLGIPTVARDIKADLVVLGAVSRSGLSRLIIGSTAELLLDRLHCDLLIVKPTRLKARIAHAAAGARIIPAVPPMTM